MPVEIRLINCLYLMIPLLAWNLALAPRITQEKVFSDAHSPAWLLVAENLFRLGVFILPLLIPLRLDSLLSKAGLAVYIAGTLIYFATCIPLLLAPESAWASSPAGLLAPRLTPFLSMLGIALIGHSWPYGALSAVFIALHTWHGIQNL